MGALDRSAFDRALRVAGFDGLVLNGVLPDDLRDALAESVPSGAVENSLEGSPEYLGGHVVMVELNQVPDLPRPWRQLLDDAFTPSYEGALFGAMRLLARPRRRCARLLTYPPGGFLGAHYDGQRDKLVTQVLFINRHWEPSWGGDLELLASDGHTLLHATTPTFEHSVVNLSTPEAWHRVSPVADNALAGRRSVILEWYA